MIKQMAISILVISLFLMSGCSGNSNNIENVPENTEHTDLSGDDIMGDKYLSDSSDDSSDKLDESSGNELSDLINPDKESVSDIVDISTIDCNGADCTIIHSDYGNILIDFGSKDSIGAIQNVLDNKGIKDIDLAILTHPHIEHYGGLEEILNNYEIHRILMTNYGDISKEYESAMIAISNSNCEITAAKDGGSYSFGKIKVNIISPSVDYEDVDENSIVVLVTYKDFSMLFTGGAGMTAEKDYVNSLNDIEVLMIGSHGNDKTTSENLLDKSSPNVGIISCGDDKNAGDELLEKLQKYTIDTYRTDIDGTITIKTDGIEYNIITDNKESRYVTDENKTEDDKTDSLEKDGNIQNTNDEAKLSNTEVIDINNVDCVYTSPTSRYYHSSKSCSKLLIAKEIIESSLSDAQSAGLEKCPKCW